MAGGTFTLTYNGVSTGDIPMDASQETVQGAVSGLSTVTSIKEVRAPGHEWWRKPLRTVVQLIMGGLLTAIVGYLVQHYGPSFSPAAWTTLYGVATALTSAAQNYGEARGWIPTTIVPPAPTVIKTTATTSSAPLSLESTPLLVETGPLEPAPDEPVQGFGASRMPARGSVPQASPDVMRDDPTTSL